ncbi:EamA domain-containing protein [Cephalotus follicularis]|uniref:WAT1-related protein n=1 Tax=Cephalotus follicularis TaxID=3775 RepID=A0A1Q3C720_CEPFO|nr:EamA domain-containing protein [Cephalotus follicularis]
MSMESRAKILNRAKPYGAVILLQFGYAGMSIISKFALNQGMSQHVLVVYRYAIATVVFGPFAIAFEGKVRPKMTISVLLKIFFLGLLEPTIDQNLFYTGMKYTTATFSSAMCNVLPAFAFLMAWMCRLENVNIRKLPSQAKILGTVVTVGGAMVMTLFKGPLMHLPWNNHQESTRSFIKQDLVKGSLMMASGCFSWSAFIILQAITLKSYPAELSLTALICLMGTIENTIVALALEHRNSAAWSIHLDSKLLACVYGGIISSGVGYYIQAVIIKTKGPVFVTCFNPLSMVIVAIMSSFILAEIMYFGRVIGAAFIVVGLYLTVWGKSRDRPESASDIDKVTPTDQQMATINERTGISNQEFVALDVAKIRPTNESV